jgi:hypothetical protein
LPYVFPGDPRGLTIDRTPRSSFDFGRPGSFDFSGIVCLGCIETCQEFGCHVGTFGDWQSERFAQEFLGSRGHGAILHPERNHTPVEDQPSDYTDSMNAAQVRTQIRSVFREQMRLTRVAQIASEQLRRVTSQRHANGGVNDPVCSSAGPPCVAGVADVNITVAGIEMKHGFSRR